MFAYAKPEQKSKDTVQKKELEKKVAAPNQTGIPDTMKARFENLSGFSFDDVRVHYNSDKPVQLQALAYTQGNQVYVAPGQEKHLGHELGHVVQQKEGRVRSTVKVNDFFVNDDPILEREADEGIVQRQVINDGLTAKSDVIGNEVIQAYNVMNTTYLEGEDIGWTQIQSNNLAAAFASANAKLNAAYGVCPDATVQGYINAVITELAQPGLDIYPLKNSAAYAGAVNGVGIHIISIKKNLTVNQMAKTLIHEAFHITGGCWGVDEYSCAVSKVNAYNQMFTGGVLRPLTEINADSFAQYVIT